MSSNQSLRRIDAQRFKRVSEQVAGQWRTFLQVECGVCGATEKVTSPPGAPADITSLAGKQFHAMGWLIGTTAALTMRTQRRSRSRTRRHRRSPFSAASPASRRRPSRRRRR